MTKMVNFFRPISVRESIWFGNPCGIYVMPELKALQVGCGEEPISFKIKVLKYKIDL